MNTLDLAKHGPVIPVIVINKVEDAVPMAEALLEGGIKVFELSCDEIPEWEVSPGKFVAARGYNASVFLTRWLSSWRSSSRCWASNLRRMNSTHGRNSSFSICALSASDNLSAAVCATGPRRP